MATKFEDSECFYAFRLAARQVRESPIIASGQGVSISGEVGADGGIKETITLLNNVAFRSLAVSLRLVFANDDAGNFGGVCNRLVSVVSADRVERVKQLRAGYNQLFNGHTWVFKLHGQFEGEVVGPRQVFETWLYHGLVHADPDRRAKFEELTRFGARFLMAVQAIALQVSGLVLDLDDILADHLGEPRVPRIGSDELPAA